MFKVVRKERPGLRTGFPALDRLMDIGSGLVTLRSPHTDWLSMLSANILVRNHKPGRRSLYLHWVDYHRRYWTLDFDRMARLCKAMGKDLQALSRDTFFIRAFSRDTAEAEENWERIFSFSEGLGFAILDSVSELFEAERASRYGRKEAHASRRGDGRGYASRRGDGRGGGSRKPVQRNRVYAIGMFSRLCMLADCPGVVLDHSDRDIHPFLGEVSSVVMEFSLDDQVRVDLVKHPRLGGSRVSLGHPRQDTLRGWLQ